MASTFGETPSGQFIDAVLQCEIERARDILRDHPEICTDCDATGDSVLQHLASENGIEGVRLLLEAGADPNGGRDPEAETPLHAAAWGGTRRFANSCSRPVLMFARWAG